LSFIVIAVGIIILLVSLFADLIGIGVAGFGYKQTTGTIIGAVIGIIGLIFYLIWRRIPEGKS
jgi:hypothetical protein